MTHGGQNRWYRDGYLARMNGKPRSTNPKAPGGYGRQATWTRKAERWDSGWLHANEAMAGRVEWDNEIDAMREIS